MKVTHRTGAACDVCHRAIGDKDSGISSIYSVDQWNNPGKTINLCSRDLEEYQELVRQERESIANLVKEVGLESLTDRQKYQYKN